MNKFKERRPLRAEGPAVRRVIGIALNVDDLGLLALRHVTVRIHDDAATDRTIGAGVAGFGRACEFPGADRRCIGNFNVTEPECAECRCCDTCTRADNELTPRQFYIHRTRSPAPVRPPIGTLFEASSSAC